MTNETKHTTGQSWTAYPVGNEFNSYVLDADGEPLAIELSQTQARLIAAAPELLEALRDLQDAIVKAHNGANEQYEENPTEALDEWIGIVSAAIAKAEGR